MQDVAVLLYSTEKVEFYSCKAFLMLIQKYFLA